MITPLAILALGAIGIAFIYSAQYYNRPVLPKELGLSWILAVVSQYWVKQLIFLGMGAGLYLMVSLVHYRYWLSIAHWFYLACMVPLFLVLIPGLGTSSYGAQRWIDFGFFSYQHRRRQSRPCS